MYSRFIAVLSLFLVFLGLVSALPSPNRVPRQVASLSVPASLASPTSTGSPQVTTTLIAASSTASPKAAAAFVLPGTSLQVLPVGLVVYAGITAITIFAVAFVTWERIQSRRTFRQQRMIENNSFGYGRMTKGGV